MDCITCNSELERYSEGKLPDIIRLQIEEHLSGCSECKENLNLIKIADNVIDEERRIESNPFISTRVIAAIEGIENRRNNSVINTIFEKSLKPALISVSLVCALLLGIIAGSLNKPFDDSEQIPDEITYLNDSYIESLDYFIIE
jgi:predicted anti-sigma-YlaC factor YlaD